MMVRAEGCPSLGIKYANVAKGQNESSGYLCGHGRRAVASVGPLLDFSQYTIEPGCMTKKLAKKHKLILKKEKSIEKRLSYTVFSRFSVSK